MAPEHGAHQTDDAYVVSLCEDFCKSPVAPVGYMISQRLSVSERVCTSVNALGTPVLNFGSLISSVVGNEAGVGGGVISGVNLGMCRPCADAAPRLRAEGQCVLRHDTVMHMNTPGPEGASNIDGKLKIITFYDRLCKDDNKPHTILTPTQQKVTVKGPDGKEHNIPVFSTDGDGCAYSVDPNTNTAKILIGKNHNPNCMDNELDTANRDVQDNVLDGKIPSQDGGNLSGLEAEIKSDEASLKAMDEDRQKKLKECKEGKWMVGRLLCECDGLGAHWLNRRGIQNRKKAMESANDKLKKGDIKGAEEVAKKNDDACLYIESAINEAKRGTTP